ncbi:endothelin-converting enzyme homolog [Colletes gigas]|uniref:endothelin-converting enzyme homolog n=1 Tax=Colletes gigas TaxID=935657 RepID=UPI001C9B468B|nr:endothelin-converting enzyme homolog [Colletes gigas]
MQLLWLICRLTAVTAIPTSLSVARIWRIPSTMNDTDSRPENDYHEDREQRICETTHCNQIAKKILESMDTSADPCTDFYQYVCGSWGTHNPIPDNELEWSEDYIVMQKTYKRIRDVLEQRDKPTDIPPVKLAREFYRSCMNEDAIEKRGIKPIQEILDATGGWPMAMPVRTWESNKVAWQKIDKHYMKILGFSSLFGIHCEVDPNNTKKYVLAIDQDTDYILASKKGKNAYANEKDMYALGLFRIAAAFAREKGYHLQKRQLISDMAKMEAFEIELFQILETNKDLSFYKDNYKRMTIEELQKWYNDSGVTASTAKMNFLDVIQHAFRLGNISANASDPIVVYNPEFLHDLAGLLGNTSRRVLVNYIQWNIVRNFLEYTTKEMRNIMFNMSFSSYNVSHHMPRWQFCVLNMEMEDAVSYMFVKKYITNDVIDKTKQMAERVQGALRRHLMQARWLSKDVKESLVKKLDDVVTQIGYPDWYNDDKAMIRRYEGLEIGSDYMTNILNCLKQDIIWSLKIFVAPVERTQWTDYPITVNAFNDREVNVILIPAAELQDPYFTPLLPDAVNYGATGFIIGHELSHSFDDDGILYDAEGYKSEWIPQEVLDEYENRTTCYINQYDDYTLDVLDENGTYIQLDGNLTKTENLADSVGIQVAFAAYQILAKEKPQTKLPGLENVTNDELFFLAFANSWCSSIRPEYETDEANIEGHSPAKYRVIGPLSNMVEFSQTFKCPENSSMNPQDKCTLWN